MQVWPPSGVITQAVIKLAASAASLRGGRTSGQLDHVFFVLRLLAALAAKKYANVTEKNIHLFHPSSQAPGPGLVQGPRPGACKEG